MRIKQVVADGQVKLRLGRTHLQLLPSEEEEEVEILDEAHFGSLLGGTPVMRELFRKLKLAAQKDVTILIEGETGTGKELVAREIHAHSRRRDKPFLVLDCGAIPPMLIESELYGHERGSFTGAAGARAGVFEAANGGTVFFDEIGELELLMQPRLLRILESQEVKRVGATRHKRIDVRVIAATHRDLQRAVNDGSFRSDLFYRLAVVRLRLPALHQRADDIPLLVESLLPDIAYRVGAEVPEISAAQMEELKAYPWPGNVRELRNFLERMVTLESDIQLPMVAGGSDTAEVPPTDIGDLSSQPFKEAKARWTAQFDVLYLTQLLDRCQYNVAEAARQSGIDRVHLFRLIKKYNLRRPKG